LPLRELELLFNICLKDLKDKEDEKKRYYIMLIFAFFN